MTVRPEDVDDPSGWIDLVEDGRLLDCPWCGINACIRRNNGRKWVQYFKGSSGIISHMNQNHAREIASITEAGGKKKAVIQNGKRLDKRELESYNNGGKGVTCKYLLQVGVVGTNSLSVEAYVPFNNAYKTWRQSLRSDSAEDTADRNSRPEKRRRVDYDSDNGGDDVVHLTMPVAPVAENMTTRYVVFVYYQ